VADVDLDQIVAELDAEVRRRRMRGDYPEGLEQQLSSEFDAMMRAIDRDEVDTTRLGQLVDGIAGATAHVSNDALTASRVPFGSGVHATTGRLIARHSAHLATNVRTLGASVTEAMDEVRRLVDAQRAADERQLHDAIAGVLDRLAVLDHVVELVRDVEQRLDALERGERPAT
jgi:hypothetical protein